MERDGEDSFDPRRWGIGATAPQGAVPGPAGERPEPSFDPRSWITPPEPTAPSPPSRAVPPPRAARPVPGDRRRPLALASGAVIALVGTGTAWLARAPDRPIERAISPVAVPIPPVRRILMVADAAGIAPSLLDAGIAPDDAHRAGAAAAAALGSARGDIRLVFEMAGPPGAARLGFVEALHDDGSGLALARRGSGFVAHVYGAKLTTELRVVRGTLDAQSFYGAAVAAGINDTLVSDFAGAFAFDFDFQREVGPGSIVAAVYERRVNAEGEPVGVPVLAYAALASGTKARALYRFTGPSEHTPGWYDASGRSAVRALMRTPIDGARISSPFGMRDHPILGFMKLHKGTDFAAPVGTPIFAAGDATVEFAGLKGPNGNFVKLHHDNGWETLYLHMNRIWPQVSAGARVQQGQQIGEVGTTGRSTGPHLHYEVHVAGEPVDPLGIDAGTGKALSGTTLAAFKRARARIDARLAAGG